MTTREDKARQAAKAFLESVRLATHDQYEEAFVEGSFLAGVRWGESVPTERELKLVEALKVAKRGIENSASDTVWCVDSDSPNCTVCDWIDIELSSYEAEMKRDEK